VASSPTGICRARWPAAIAVTGLALGAPGCAHSLRADRCPIRTLADSTAPRVDIQYLGSGGFLVSRGADVALFAPVYSNPTAPEVFLGHEFRTEARLVDSLLPVEANKAQAIIVGHSHYDHLLDTPWIATHRARLANIYGSSTVKRLLASLRPELERRQPPNEIVALDKEAETKAWIAIPNSRMRLLAIPSEHSDPLRIGLLGLSWPIHAFRGELTEDAPALPRKAAEWPEGRTFAYLLDFLNDWGETEFRLYFQDSATREGVGFGPALSDADYRKVDVALICGSGHTRELKHPEELVKHLKPRHVIVGHWEDFFVTQRAICSEKEVRGLPFEDPIRVVDAARAAQKDAKQAPSVYLPCPTASRFQVAIEPGADRSRQKKETVAYDCTKIR
jgi:hypothetical protein